MRPSVYSLRAFKLGLAAARLLPRNVAHRVAVALAHRIYMHHGGAREALAHNLRVVTGATGEEINRLCSANVSNFACMLADYFYCAGGGNARDLLDQWEGIEHLETARREGRGVILVTAHLGNWELGGILLALRGFPMSVVTLEEPTSELTRWRDTYRRQSGIRTHAVGPGHDFAIVELIRTLRSGGIVAMLVDRPYAGSGLPVEFFGRKTEFSSAPGLLWQHTGAAVIPAFVLHNDSGRYTAFAQAPLAFSKSTEPRADLAANTQLLATHFEHVIRKHPEQWFNYVPIWPAPVDVFNGAAVPSGAQCGAQP
jgi:lauroyl/myristoyl acyltransferase